MISERDLLDRLENVKRRRDDEWMARCPAHADAIPSLHVTRKPARWLFKCHAGCDTADVLAAVGLDWGDLFAENGRSEIVETYDYVDERGQLLFETVRYWPKDFRRPRSFRVFSRPGRKASQSGRAALPPHPWPVTSAAAAWRSDGCVAPAGMSAWMTGPINQ
jgi:hypothetical protein